ncbi:uncharacterized protein CPUR_08828 [Claviceps purpurea 20.1]|uniref:Uncharacterized protein n=1 Tax=Claviceps purpurea (strain 20.1) TaxID=1111077 RepID=M1WIQ5_CLAP2|nr:uncharacterized protein CPUR_08828 [Claviceps purpurea 20.1]
MGNRWNNGQMIRNRRQQCEESDTPTDPTKRSEH